MGRILPNFDEYSYLFFDLDGTLTDTTGVLADVGRDYCRAHGIEPSPTIAKDIFLYIHLYNTQYSYEAMTRGINESHGIKTPLMEGTGMMIDFAIRRYSSAKLKAGASEFLKKMASKKVLGMVTSNDPKVIEAVFSSPHIVETIDLAKIFSDRIIHGRICDEAKKQKPNPYGFHLLLSQIGGTKDKLLIFEDSGSGLEAGYGATKNKKGTVIIKDTITNPTNQLLQKYTSFDITDWVELNEYCAK